MATHPFLPRVAIVLGLAVGLTGCGSDSTSTGATSTTVTTPKSVTTTVLTETTEPTQTTVADDASFSDIDLGEQLNPIDGFTYETLPEEARSALVNALGSNADVKELVSAVGTTTVTDSSGASLLIFLGLNRELSADEAKDLVDGITSGGTNIEQGEVAGQTGWAYVSTDGQQGFATVRAMTAIIGLSDSSEHLAAVIKGLFEANPDL